MKKLLLVSATALFIGNVAHAAPGPSTVNGGTVHFQGEFVNAASEMALNKTGSTILFQTINDYGAFTQKTKIDIQ